jgi:hypothetical protein
VGRVSGIFFEGRISVTKTEKRMVEKNLDLIFEFEKYVLEHPGIVRKIPRNAIVSMRLQGDGKFNRWSKGLAEKQGGRKRPVYCVTIKKLKPALSRIAELEVERAA